NTNDKKPPMINIPQVSARVATGSYLLHAFVFIICRIRGIKRTNLREGLVLRRQSTHSCSVRRSIEERLVSGKCKRSVESLSCYGSRCEGQPLRSSTTTAPEIPPPSQRTALASLRARSRYLASNEAL